jgi:hypothetical protein
MSYLGDVVSKQDKMLLVLAFHTAKIAKHKENMTCRIRVMRKENHGQSFL